MMLFGRQNHLVKEVKRSENRVAKAVAKTVKWFAYKLKNRIFLAILRKM